MLFYALVLLNAQILVFVYFCVFQVFEYERKRKTTHISHDECLAGTDGGFPTPQVVSRLIQVAERIR